MTTDEELADLRDAIKSTVAMLYEKARAYQRLASAGGTDTATAGECAAAANAYEHAAMMLREETET